MKLLLDTHVLIWWLDRNPRLLVSSLALLVDPSNALFFSCASAFEIVAKASAGKLKLPTDPASFIASAMKQGRIDELPLFLRHTYRVAQLPPIHKDPFDRMLIATAIEEDLTMLTYDQDIRKYPLKLAW